CPQLDSVGAQLVDVLKRARMALACVSAFGMPTEKTAELFLQAPICMERLGAWLTKNRLMTESSVAKATTTTAAAAMTMTTTTSLALTEMVDRVISANEALLNDLKEVRRIS